MRTESNPMRNERHFVFHCSQRSFCFLLSPRCYDVVIPMRIILLFLCSLSLAALGDTSVLSGYGELRHLAGTGNAKDANFWDPTFEGAHPLAVELSNPHDCGSDAFGRVYIVDKESHSVLRISANGAVLTTVAGTHIAGDGPDSGTPATSVALANPNGLHVLNNGTFYILDTDNAKIRRVTPDGNCSTVVHHPAGFGAGRGLWVSPDEQTIYFNGANVGGGLQAVMKWTPATGATELTRLPHGSGSDGFGLGNLDVAPDGSVGITSLGNQLVYRFDGETSYVIAGTGSTSGTNGSGSVATEVALNRPRGIAFLPDGSYFIATQKGGDVWWVDTSGIIHLFVQGAGSGNVNAGNGQPWTVAGDKIAEPRAVHLATNGDLLITTNDRGFIRAVDNVCLPIVPTPTLRSLDGELAFDWQAAYKSGLLLESSESPAGPWSIETAPNDSAAILPLDGPSRFYRLRATVLSGGR